MKVPIPPLPPPCRVFNDHFLGGMVETKESKQATKDWRKYINEYRKDIR